MKNWKIGCILFAAVTLAGCATANPFASLTNPPAEPKKLAAYTQNESIVEHSVPVTVAVTPAGEKVVAFETARSTDRSYGANAQETKGASKIKGFFSDWKFWAVVFIVLMVFLPGFREIVDSLLRGLKGFSGKVLLPGMKQTVAGIEEFLQRTDVDDKAKQILKDALSKKMNTNTKAVVNKLKVESTGG